MGGEGGFVAVGGAGCCWPGPWVVVVCVGDVPLGVREKINTKTKVPTRLTHTHNGLPTTVSVPTGTPTKHHHHAERGRRRTAALVLRSSLTLWWLNLSPRPGSDMEEEQQL